MPPTSPRVYLIEDHPMMRQVVCEYLTYASGVELAGVAASAEEALLGLRETSPDLVLLDLSLPDMNGLDLLTRIRDETPALPCLILSGHGEGRYVRKAMARGAAGYVLKGHPAEISAAIRAVLNGESYLSESLRSTVAEDAGA